MKLDSLKDLEKLIRLCRKTGVNHITVDGVTLELGYEPSVTKRTKKVQVTNDTFGEISEQDSVPMPDRIEVDGLTDEELLMWSAVPHDTPQKEVN